MADQSRPVILVVDDAPENITIVKKVLGEEYIVRPAIHGKAALKAVTVDPVPDLILLDVMMPEMDGYAVCQQLKSDPATQNIPVIFVTGRQHEEDELRGLSLGAVDYITKPFSPAIVRARLQTHLALRMANRTVDEHNRLLMEERELIEHIILKMRLADGLDARYVRHLISPVEATTGDLLFSTFTPDGRHMVFLGDFTGHGLIAAIGGPLVGYIFQQLVKSGARGESILQEINSQLYQRMPSDVFLAAVLLEISADRTQVTLWNASLPHVLLMRQGGIQGRFESGMLALGIVKELNVSRSAVTFAVEPGDRLYIFSDGIIEASDGDYDQFGLQRLEEFLVNMVAGKHVLTDLIALLDRHVGATVHHDDITLIEVEVG